MGFLSSALGAVAGIGYDIYKTNSANKHAKRAQERQMAWQEEMSNTAHQREVADLRAAGINPIYTATGGSGASTPSGSPGQAFKGDGDPVNSAVATYRARLENKAIENAIKKTASDISLNKAHERNIDAQKTAQDLQNKISLLNMPAQEQSAKANYYNAEHQAYQAQSPTFQWFKAVAPIINSAMNLGSFYNNFQNMRSTRQLADRPNVKSIRTYKGKQNSLTLYDY